MSVLSTEQKSIRTAVVERRSAKNPNKATIISKVRVWEVVTRNELNFRQPEPRMLKIAMTAVTFANIELTTDVTYKGVSVVSYTF